MQFLLWMEQLGLMIINRFLQLTLEKIFQRFEDEMKLNKIKPNDLENHTTTLPETNIAPENRPSQKESSLPTIHFQVLC